ncbi:hypothetical protein ABZ700_11595 [Streptomyces diastaticus]|uniref:hypothetical protein n=1 Tax=Streptomyces diastaticus TaxID=1956 RepID=UPI0033C79B5C
MKKHLMALPLAALAVIGMSGCTAVVVPDEPQATVTVSPQDSDAQPSQDAEQGSQTQDSETKPAVPSQEQEAGTTIDLGGDEMKGTVYLEAVQSFSPYLSKFVVDGDTLHYSRYTCLGEDEGSRATGTLGAWHINEELQEIQWPGETDLQTGPLAITDQLLETSLVTGDEMASSDLEAQKSRFSSMCMDAGQSIAEFIL